MSEHIEEPLRFVGTRGVVTPGPDDSFTQEFDGVCVGVRNGFLQVRDSDDDVHEVEVRQYTPAPSGAATARYESIRGENKMYWAFVGRIPEGENSCWATNKPETGQDAVAQFQAFLLEENALTPADEMELELGYGSAYIIDGAFSSKSSIAVHGDVQ